MCECYCCSIIKLNSKEAIKIIYEYMSNDNLERFIKKRKIK